MLTEDLGPAVFNRVAVRDDGQPVGLFRLLMRPAGLFALALIALITVLTIKLWRDGVFESFRQHNVARTMTDDKRWMLGDRLAPPPAEKMIEPLQPQPRPAVSVTEPNAADPGDEPEE
ncbi:hypothetical protein [Sphingomonas sp.]|uniref:hypothetical protein n=1 Tax=Sphingomonas sp. TaxID=28214 RepID=UPI0025F78527|nr:hypothetical protein [Sphingomonas sp.]